MLDSLTGLPAIDFSWFAAIPSANTAYLTGSREIQPDSFVESVVQIRLGTGSWRLRPVPSLSFLPTGMPRLARAIRFTDDSTGAVVFNDGFGSFHYGTTNGGRTWTSRMLESFDNGEMEVSVADARHFLFHVWSPGNQNLPLKSLMGEPEMAAFPPPPVGPPSSSLPTGLELNFQENTSRLLLLPSGVGWAVGGRGRIYYTTDFGATFTLRTLLLDQNDPMDIDFPDPSHGWAAGYKNLIHTSDAGSTWARVALPNPPNFSQSLNAAAFPDADTLVLATGFWPTAYTNYLLSSRDAGQTWTSFATPGNQPVNDIRFWGGARRGLAVGRGGTILRTTDGGQTWLPSASGTTTSLSRVIWQDAQTVYVLGGTVLKSTDGGVSWQTISSPFPAGTEDAAFPTPQLGFARTTRQLHRTTDGGVTWQMIVNPLFAQSGGFIKTKFSFASPQHGWYNGYVTQDSGQTWIQQPFVGPTAVVDADNSYVLLNYADYTGGDANAARVVRYSKHFLRAAPLATTTLTTGSTYSIAFTTEGTFTAAERDFRVELSNVMGRFRPGQTTTIGRGAASPISVALPANLPLGTRYRLRVVRADSSVLGADNGQGLTLRRPTGLASDDDLLVAPQLYPNPAQQTVSVRFAEGAQAGRQVRLLDLTGRAVLVQPATAAETPVSLRGLGAGCYLLEVRAAGGGVQTQRLMVQP